MQESFYESGNCVQIICANEGVHPKNLGTTWEQNTLFSTPVLTALRVRHLAMLNDRAPAETDRHARFVRNLNRFVRVHLVVI